MAWWLGIAAVAARGQAEIRDFTRPIPVFNSGGHHAPVRAIAFTPDGSQLLTAGFDKVIHVWNLREGRPQLARTIRPPIWRGARGRIYAMDLAPAADAAGQRMLAVAGLGVESRGGGITLFRFPGTHPEATGDVDAFLPSGQRGDPAPQGHTDTVMCLAFSPDGKRLATAGLDETARIWDVGARPVRTLAILRGHADAVNVLSFSPDGGRIATGGADGVIRLWDATTGNPIGRATPAWDARDPGGRVLLAMAHSPDGRWVVAGREDGRLFRYDAATLGGEQALPTTARQGPVEALAFSPDGSRLAASLVSRRIGRPSDLPEVGCDIELRDMPLGTVRSLVAATTDLAQALRFGPDGSTLAYAGGDAQPVFLKDLRDDRAAPVELAGVGASIWDVGFGGDGPTVGLSDRRPDRADAPDRYTSFDFRTRAVATLPRDGLVRALASDGGLTIRPVGPYELDVVDAQGRGHRLRLDASQDRRWWSYGLIPPGPGHPRRTVAIGCEAGVVFFRADTGERTRIFAGHEGPVYSLAASPDGRWLATGSSDQTVRLWRLAGCDALPPLGARFERTPEGGWKAAGIESRGFAEAAGLREGDLIDRFVIGEEFLAPEAFLGRVGSAPPGVPVQFRVRRGAELVNVGTTRRDGPALSLFLGRDREWILWMPEGYYQTSIAGDRRHLGWHRNRARPDEPTDYFAADRFEAELRRPALLDRLLETADPAQALALVAAPDRDGAAVVGEARPPTIRLDVPGRRADRPLAVGDGELPFLARVAADGGPSIRSLRVQVDGRREPPIVFDPPRAEAAEPIRVALAPGPHRVTVTAANDRGKERSEGFDVTYDRPRTAPPGLVIRAFGTNRLARLPDRSIRYADRDARDLSAFFAEPGGKRWFDRIDRPEPLVGEAATAKQLGELLVGLDSDREAGKIGRGDVVILALEAHIAGGDGEPVLVGADSGDGLPPSDSLPASRVTECLAGLANDGCRVMLLLDGVHPSAPKEWRGRADGWVRDLWKRDVIAFVASNSGPGERDMDGRHGAFAQAILDSFDLAARSRSGADPHGPVSLREFQEVVVGRVLELTSRRQVASCYIPETIPSRLPILAPPEGAGDGAAPGPPPTRP
ncbi:hypothetical protein TA3x_001576 [Tundrisphaera sp. TA3]|uniref:hypothetical protein n=1 Tax=Tundrisphaera sp. TA3 TaxID=3435775 RepID=UPI003EBB44F3